LVNILKGLQWAIGLFGSAHSALIYGFNRADRNTIPDPSAYQDYHAPDGEPLITNPKRAEFSDYCADDHNVLASKILDDAREIAGADWPILEMAFSGCDKRRIRAIETVQDMLLYDYPPEYILIVCAGWKATSKIQKSVLAHLAGVSDRQERRWRGDITELLNKEFDRIMSKMD